MSDAVLKAAIERVLSSPLVGASVEFLWHAGEPLAVARAFYEKAIAWQKEFCSPGTSIYNIVQTNAVLIGDEWCRFFRDHNFRVGVSIDGPAELHDKMRVFWNGRGSHAKVMQGVRKLQSHGLRFGALCVISRHHLAHANTLYRFFRDNNFSWVGFNIEENEGVHAISSLNEHPADDYAQFFRELYDLWMSEGRPFVIREFDDFHDVIFDVRANASFARKPDETVPFAIVTVTRDGDFSTFSPELATMQSARYGNFRLGNVLSDSIEESALDRRSDILEDVTEGIRNCRDGCEFFAFCGGAFLSNRIVEHDSFVVPQTNACRLHRKTLFPVVLDGLHARSKQ